MVFADAVNVTVPLPVPLEPAVTMIHGAPELAAHRQPAGAVTVTLPVPPVEGTDWLVGVMVKEQPDAA